MEENGRSLKIVKFYQHIILKKAAEQTGRGIAKKAHTELATHGMDGKIRSKDSFGNDPFSIKDKEH